MGCLGALLSGPLTLLTGYIIRNILAAETASTTAVLPIVADKLLKNKGDNSTVDAAMAKLTINLKAYRSSLKNFQRPEFDGRTYCCRF
jgi:hypothetical protein